VNTWLLVLIPVLVAPIVLLLAFTGCTPFEAADRPEDKPPEPTPEPTPTPPTPPTPVPDPKTYPEVIAATPGLHCYWRLDDASGIQATDSGPLKHHGTYSGGVAPGTAAGALQPKLPGDRATVFDGNNDHVTVPFHANLNPASFSVEAWIRPANTAQYDAIISSWQLTATVAQGFELGLEAPDVVRGRVGIGADHTVLETQAPSTAQNPVQNTWHHVAMTFDAGTGMLVLYWDGGPIATDPVAYTANIGSDPLRIGAGRLPFQPANTNPANFFAGTIDEVALYGRALLAAEVTAHFQAR
jgi:hypothetical protein